jgi:Beta-propeller repeat
MKTESYYQRNCFKLHCLFTALVACASTFFGLVATGEQVQPAPQMCAQVLRNATGFSIAPTDDVQQAWVAQLDGNQAGPVVVDASGNVYVTGGSMGSNNYSSYATIKYNPAGQQQWVAYYSASGIYDSASSIAIDSSGNVYVTGGSSGADGYFDYATVKYNSAGEQQWVARYDGSGNDDLALAIVVDASGNVVVTGTSRGPNNDIDYATVKYNSAGEQQWVARYDGPRHQNDLPSAIAIDSVGNVYVTGTSFGGSYYDYATIKYNPAGQQQWVARYNGYNSSRDDEARAIGVDGSGHVYVTGLSGATIKYNSAGQEQWVAQFEGSAAALVIDGSGNLYVAGGGLPPDGYVTTKYNSVGEEEWVANYHGTGGYDYATAAALDGSGNFYVTGRSEGLPGDTDYATVKYNSSGERLWVATFDEGYDAVNSIAVDGLHNVYVTGTSDGRYTTIKYIQEPTPTPRSSTTPRPTSTPKVRPTSPPHITPVPPPPSPRPTAVPRPTPPPHLTPVPTPSSPRPTSAPRP